MSSLKCLYVVVVEISRVYALRLYIYVYVYLTIHPLMSLPTRQPILCRRLHANYLPLRLPIYNAVAVELTTRSRLSYPKLGRDLGSWILMRRTPGRSSLVGAMELLPFLGGLEAAELIEACLRNVLNRLPCG